MATMPSCFSTCENGTPALRRPFSSPTTACAAGLSASRCDNGGSGTTRSACDSGGAHCGLSHAMRITYAT
jgi:hypothetical protein